MRSSQSHEAVWAVWRKYGENRLKIIKKEKRSGEKEEKKCSGKKWN